MMEIHPKHKWKFVPFGVCIKLSYCCVQDIFRSSDDKEEEKKAQKKNSLKKKICRVYF
jgi:hypothetical protein